MLGVAFSGHNFFERARSKVLELNPQKPTATMKDVAEKAGVSTATVSRALMNPDKVSVATRQKVEQAVMPSAMLPTV
nr:HTH-type transcriptional repressor CytR [Candidatus Pantoea persica]